MKTLNVMLFRHMRSALMVMVNGEKDLEAKSQWWWRFQFRDTSPVELQRLMGCFSLPSLDNSSTAGSSRFIKSAFVAHAQSVFSIASTALGTIRGGIILFPEFPEIENKV